MMSVFLPEHMAAEAGADIVDDAVFGPDSVSRIDEALALLEEGPADLYVAGSPRAYRAALPNRNI